MERSKFITQTCAMCMLAGTGLLSALLTSCSTLPVYKTVLLDNKITVPAVLFDNGNLQLIRAKDYEYDIALRKTDNGYIALLMRCTHADAALVNTGNSFLCNNHGSTFNSNGAVTKGPANDPLKKFRTETTSTEIIIYI